MECSRSGQGAGIHMAWARSRPTTFAVLKIHRAKMNHVVLSKLKLKNLPFVLKSTLPITYLSHKSLLYDPPSGALHTIASLRAMSWNTLQPCMALSLFPALHTPPSPQTQKGIYGGVFVSSVRKNKNIKVKAQWVIKKGRTGACIKTQRMIK